MMRRPGVWAMVWILVVGLVGCETSAGSGSSERETAQTDSPDERNERRELDSGPFEYVRSVAETGDAPGQLRDPVGLAVDDGGDLYVAEGGNDRLQKLGAEGESLAVWAECIGRPMHVDVDDGRLAVPAYNEDTVHIYEGPGEEVDSFGGDWVDAPAGVDIGPEGRFYVADFYNHRFHVVGTDLELEQTYGEKGQQPGQFTYPTDIEVTPDGDIWIADAYAHRIQILSPEGEHRRTLGKKGSDGPGQFRVATGIDRGPEGHLYVADFKNDRVQVLESDGEPVAMIDGTGEDASSMKHPTEVVATERKLYVVDHGNDQIDVYRRTDD